MAGTYRPNYSLPEYADRVEKRKRQPDQAVRNKRPRGDPNHRPHTNRADQDTNFGPNADWYRPNYGSDSRPHINETDSDANFSPNADYYRPNYDRKPETGTAPISQNTTEAVEPHNKNKKSLKERKQNPSTQIKSLRNLITRGRLLPAVQQVKERELAGLLFEQQKNSIKQNARKNLKRYHFIRFVERQKATRTIKKLKKEQEAKGDSSEKLKRQLHEAEVDLNYTLYTPLAQKYVAIYARDDNADGKAQPLARNLSGMNKKDYALLSEDQRHEIEVASLEAANALHLADSASGVKPPMWYVVEATMEKGEKALEALRDQQDKVKEVDLTVGRGAKAAPDWLTDGGEINPEDLDSDSEDNGGVAVAARDDDDKMSDGDGGFFEKR